VWICELDWGATTTILAAIVTSGTALYISSQWKTQKNLEAISNNAEKILPYLDELGKSLIFYKNYLDLMLTTFIDCEDWHPSISITERVDKFLIDLSEKDFIQKQSIFEYNLVAFKSSIKSNNIELLKLLEDCKINLQKYAQFISQIKRHDSEIKNAKYYEELLENHRNLAKVCDKQLLSLIEVCHDYTNFSNRN